MTTRIEEDQILCTDGSILSYLLDSVLVNHSTLGLLPWQGDFPLSRRHYDTLLLPAHFGPFLHAADQAR